MKHTDPPSVVEALSLLRVIPDAWIPGLTKLCAPEAGHSHQGEPCSTPGKRPLLMKFNRQALEQYEAAERGRFDLEAARMRVAGWLSKGYNIGLVPPEGVVVLDCDTEPTVEWVSSHVAGLAGVPRQLRTPAKAHFWLRYDPAELPLLAKGLRWDDCQLDLRVGGRSQAVVAPSKHESGVHYEWLDGCGLPQRIDDLPWLPLPLGHALDALMGPRVAARAAARGVADAGAGMGTGATAIPGHDRLLGYVNRLCRYASGEDAAKACESIRVKAEAYAEELYGGREGGRARLDGILREGGELDRLISTGWERFGGSAPLMEDRTDQGYLEFLEATYGAQWLYVIERRTWLQWDPADGYWQDTHEEVIGHAIGALHAILFEDALRETDPERRERLTAMSRQLRNNSKVESILRRGRKAYGVSETRLDASPQLIAFPGGTFHGEHYPPTTLDLDALTSHASRPEDRITRVVGAPYVPPGAESSDPVGEGAAVWGRFLTETLPDPELRDYVQRAMGLSLYGRTLQHVFFFLFGGGGTGKSTLLNALADSLGGYARKADFGTFAEGGRASGGNASPDVARLKGARLVVCSEIPARARLGARMKDLTGGDLVLARHLYGTPIEFVPQHTVWVAGNTEPQADYMDAGVWRRMRQLPVDQVHPSPDERLPGRLAQPDARAAILRWSLLGWIEYRSRHDAGEPGLGSCEAVEQATQSFRQRLNPIEDWFNEACETGPGFETPVATLYSAYCHWMDDQFGHSSRADAPRASKRQFGSLLRERGLEVRKGSRGLRLFIGVRLAPEGPATAMTAPPSRASGPHAGASLPPA